jgi:hypothetical protein
MINLINMGDFDGFINLLTPVVIGYFASWFVLFIIGAIVQYCLRRHKKAKKKEDSDDESEFRFYLIKKK